MAFHDVRLNTLISYGADSTVERNVNIQQLENGHEVRNATRRRSRHMYNLAYAMKDYNTLYAIKEFFEARGGPLHAFRFKDFADYKSCPPLDSIAPTDQTLGDGDGVATTFQLVKTYTSASINYVRDINKPVLNTVVISLDDVPQASGWSVDTTTGIVTFSSAPSSGVTVKAGFEFDVPVRFESQQFNTRLSAYQYGESDLELFEVYL